MELMFPRLMPVHQLMLKGLLSCFCFVLESVFLNLTSKYSFLPKQELCVLIEHTEDNSFFEVVCYLCFKWKSFRIKMPKLASFRRP